MRRQSLRQIDAPDAAASLAWLDAQLSRIRGYPARALQLAGAAADLLDTQGHPVNAGRCYTIAAECACDVVERQRGPTPRHDVTDGRGDMSRIAAVDPVQTLSWSRAAAKRALLLAKDADDQVGAGMARLALQRSARLSGRASYLERGVTTVEAVIRSARRIGDISLLGRAETALGDELAAAARGEAARTAYYRAARLLEEHQLGGLAFWPRRALE